MEEDPNLSSRKQEALLEANQKGPVLGIMRPVAAVMEALGIERPRIDKELLEELARY